MNMQKLYKNNETEKLQAPKSISLKHKNSLKIMGIRVSIYIVIICLGISFLWCIGKIAINLFGYFTPMVGVVIIWLLIIRGIAKIIYIILSTVIIITLFVLIFGLI